MVRQADRLFRVVAFRVAERFNPRLERDAFRRREGLHDETAAGGFARMLHGEQFDQRLRGAAWTEHRQEGLEVGERALSVDGSMNVGPAQPRLVGRGPPMAGTGRALVEQQRLHAAGESPQESRGQIVGPGVARADRPGQTEDRKTEAGREMRG